MKRRKEKDYPVMALMALLTIFIVTFLVVAIIRTVSSFQAEEPNAVEEPDEPTSEHLAAISQAEQEILLDKLAIYDDYFVTFDGQKKIEDLTDVEKITFIDRLPIEVQQEKGLDFEAGVPLETIQELLREYFGPDITFNPVNCPCFLGDGDYLIYDATTRTYYADTDGHGHGGYEPYQVHNFYVDGVKTSNENSITYTLTIKKAFAAPNTSSYYSSYTDALEKNNLLFDLYTLYGEKAYTDTSRLLSVQYEKNKGLFPGYVYTFTTNSTAEEAYLVNLKK